MEASHDLHRHELEPRVARVETALESVTANVNTLTNDVRALGDVMREQWQSVEKQLQGLSVGIANASAPKRTDWATLVAAGALILAVGLAVLTPLASALGEARVQITRVSQDLDAHRVLKLHPVGETRIDAIETRLRERSDNNEARIEKLAEHVTALQLAIARTEGERK